MSIESDFIWAPAPTTTRGQPTVLSADAKGERLAYASNKSIFIRSIDNPTIGRQYTQHTAATTVARFAPSGFYVASGDAAGTVRVWDCVGEGATKGEYHIISGRINDIAWDGDSQRIIAVGDGRERYGRCITADSGNSVGEITGHSGIVNAVSIRQQRPLRAATAGDDKNMVFYHGAPFKFNELVNGCHSNYIYGLAFSPDGNTLVSAGADRKVWLYDGKTGESKGQLGSGEQHTGSIFGVSWSGDSRKIVTASADRSVKIWDVEAGKTVQTWTFGGEGKVVSVPHQQVGVVWPAGRKDGLIISLSLDGDLSYLNEGTDKVTRTLQGHQKTISAITTSSGSEKASTMWTGSYDGRVCSWDVDSGVGEVVHGETHKNQVVAFAAESDSKTLYSVGWDDTVRGIDSSAKTFLGDTSKISAQPRGAARLSSGSVLIATISGLELLDSSGKPTATFPTSYTPTCIAASKKDIIAVGAEDHTIYLYHLSSITSSSSSPKIKETAHITDNSQSAISALSFSPSGSLLAAGDSSGKIFVYTTSSSSSSSAIETSLLTNRWSAHSARVTSISWNPYLSSSSSSSTTASTSHEEAEDITVASTSLDTNLHIWSLKNPGRRVKVTNAHKEGATGVVWIGREKVVSVGADAAVKGWVVKS